LILRVTFLGTGTSHGVPMIGCECAVCGSTDPRDKRTRPSILIETAGMPASESRPATVLVDTSTDLRMQALTHGVSRVDAILFTHSHADHILGLDEVRRFNIGAGVPLPCYADALTIKDIRQTFSYIFQNTGHVGGGIPQIQLTEILGPFCFEHLEIVPVPIFHGKRRILGFRMESFAYLTDCSRIPDKSWPLLEGVRTLVVDALRDRPHPTHFSVKEALEAVERIAPERAYFTHICHDLPHAATCARLPRGVELAYDGLVVQIP
jgi:phosphoribosyl 1,2-cyclic phosphate phosphodiesterase